MNGMRRVVLGKFCLLLGMLCLWPSLSQAAQDSECRNQIEILGGSTAILRGEIIDTTDKLQKAMKKKKYREAFRQILDKAKLGDRYAEVMKLIEGLQQKDLHPYGPGTDFEWMAFRHRSNKTIGLLRDSCWEGRESIDAWTFKLKVNGQERIFIIPATCLNLALLKDRPPVCELEATAECSYPPSTSKPKVIVTAKAEAWGKSDIERVVFTETLPDLKSHTDDEEPYEWQLEAATSGSYIFEAEAYDTKGLKSEKCTARVAVCEVPKDPCTPPSCSLKVHSEWSKENNSGTLEISFDHPGTDDFDLTWKREPNGEEKKASQKLEGLPEGEYTVTLVAKSKDRKCKDAVCSTTVTVEKKNEEVLPRPCCVSPWLFRAFGGWVEAQGSEVNDWIITADGEKGDFKFDFNQGMGFGMEIERLWPWKEPWKDRKLSDARWGWTLGLFRANLDTRWIFDSPQHWIRDDDRVPMLALTTGLNFHWWHQSWGFFAGPVVGFVSFEDGSYANGTTKPGTFEVNFDDSFAFGARAGFDAFLGECWGITGGAEYLKISTEADFAGRTRDVDVDPLILKAGFVYHF